MEGLERTRFLSHTSWEPRSRWIENATANKSPSGYRDVGLSLLFNVVRARALSSNLCRRPSVLRRSHEVPPRRRARARRRTWNWLYARTYKLDSNLSTVNGRQFWQPDAAGH